jgi:V8-like Glu-specific endopeptidase
MFRTNEELDYTILELDDEPGREWGYLAQSRHVLEKLARVNIIQHPGGLPKQVSLQRNFVHYSDSTIVQYVTATLPGSSGSPVLDDEWRVVALHHAGGLLTDPPSGQLAFRNEGICISRVIDDLPEEFKRLIS